ncbi:MAG: RNA methyltransferase [Terriglobales bacterium]
MNSLRVVLVRVRNPLNIGAAARAMANFGCGDLVLVEPYSEAWKTARSARAGVAVLDHARCVGTLAEALSECDAVVGTTDGGARVPELPLEDWRAVAASLPGTGAALLFGDEKSGLNVDEISHCNRLARIPTQHGAPSMNLGQAVAVCLYELARAERPLPRPPTPAAAIGVSERERLLDTWYPLLEGLGAVKPGHSASQHRLLREMLTRWRCRPADERRLLGLARQVRNRLTDG